MFRWSEGAAGSDVSDGRPAAEAEVGEGKAPGRRRLRQPTALSTRSEGCQDDASLPMFDALISGPPPEGRRGRLLAGAALSPAAVVDFCMLTAAPSVQERAQRGGGRRGCQGAAERQRPELI